MIYLHFEHCTVQLTVYMLHIYTHIYRIYLVGGGIVPQSNRVPPGNDFQTCLDLNGCCRSILGVNS